MPRGVTRLQRDYREIGTQGFLELAPPNPSAPSMEAFQRTETRSGSSFWPGLKILLGHGTYAVPDYKTKPYAPTVPQTDPHTRNPISTQRATAFGNTFLLGLRSFAWSPKGAGEGIVSSAASGSSAPAQALPGSILAHIPRPWVWWNRTTRAPRSSPVYPSFGEG